MDVFGNTLRVCRVPMYSQPVWISTPSGPGKIVMCKSCGFRCENGILQLRIQAPFGNISINPHSRRWLSKLNLHIPSESMIMKVLPLAAAFVDMIAASKAAPQQTTRVQLCYSPNKFACMPFDIPDRQCVDVRASGEKNFSRFPVCWLS